MCSDIAYYTKEDIQHINKGFKAMSTVKSSKFPVSVYQIHTRSKEDEDWTYRMESVSAEYLASCGSNWQNLGFCSEFKISKKL